MGPLPRADREAMVHTWRLIGWHLGLKDRFNVCNSVEDLEDCFQDYMQWTPQRLRTCRECTHLLQQAAADGFGAHLGLGRRYWEGFLASLHDVRGEQVPYTRVRPLPGMVSLA